MPGKIIVSVISNLVTDQRVQKECNTFFEMGYEVLLIGRKSKNKFGLNTLPYQVIRFPNLFKRGPLMYLVFNAQLFFFLLFKKADILWANDLDTLLPNFIIARVKKIRLVYDSHEYFTLSVYKPRSRKIWERLEKWIFPQLKNVVTVNDSIKNAYEQKYNVPVTVIRNVPYKATQTKAEKLHLPADKKILVMQGMGLNEHRGAEEAVLMMQFLREDFCLYFIGRGTILHKLQEMVMNLHLSKKVVFIDALPYNEMMEYTRQCFLGLIFERIDFNEEHLFSLPNKFFDYLKAGLPVLSSRAIEIEALVEKYNIGGFIDNFEPRDIAGKITNIANNMEVYRQWKLNTGVAASELCWENEEKKLKDFMRKLS